MLQSSAASHLIVAQHEKRTQKSNISELTTDLYAARQTSAGRERIYTLSSFTPQSKISRAVKVFEARYNAKCRLGRAGFAQIASLFVLSTFAANDTLPGWRGLGICRRNDVEIMLTRQT